MVARKLDAARLSPANPVHLFRRAASSRFDQDGRTWHSRPGQQRQTQPRFANVRQRLPAPTIDLGAILATKYQEMIEDLRSVAGSPCSDVTIHRGNSKQVSRVFASGADITAVITSPPYPNRFSYARETRPHLFFFDFIEGAQAVGQLETDAIGGTWGKATSVLAKGVAPANSIIESLLSSYTKNINHDGRLMGSYVTKYFNDIFQHAEEIGKVCAPRCRLAYVIGNSKFYGHVLPSDEILAKIFGHFGFALERIDRMRRRQSKTGLHEAVVFMRRKSQSTQVIRH